MLWLMVVLIEMLMAMAVVVVMIPELVRLLRLLGVVAILIVLRMGLVGWVGVRNGQVREFDYQSGQWRLVVVEKWVLVSKIILVEPFLGWGVVVSLV